MQMPANCVLCRYAARPGVLVVIGLLLFLILWLASDWLRPLLLAYLVLVVLAGLIALALVAARILIKLCAKRRADPKGSGSFGHPASGPVKVPATIYRRPDPLLYSQAQLLARGAAVTWDNPDIAIFEIPGVGLPPTPAAAHALAPGRPHLIRAQVWNGSVQAPAVNLLVRFWYLTFGIGTVRTYIGETLIDLPVKGAPGLPRIAELPWMTPAVAGHYCLQVELVWPDDADQGNNLGQTNLDVKKLNSPNASFTFPFRNDGVHAARMRFTLDAYRLPGQPPCDAYPPGQPRGEQLGRHLPAAHALPAGWQVILSPDADALLAAGEERPLAVKVVAADGFSGDLDINVNAFDGRRLVGGVTLRVHS